MGLAAGNVYEGETRTALKFFLGRLVLQAIQLNKHVKSSVSGYPGLTGKIAEEGVAQLREDR